MRHMVPGQAGLSVRGLFVLNRKGKEFGRKRRTTMKWMKFTVETTTEAAEMVGYMLTELGIEGIEIEDNIPLTKAEEEQMYIDIPAVLPEDDGTAKIHFYVMPDSEILPYYSTGSSIRDEEMDGKKGYLFSSPEELMSRIRTELEELAAYTDIGAGAISWDYTEDKDWMNNWKEFFKPFYAAEDILIKPTWEEMPPDVEKDTTVIQIDPGTAFGTGAHETTKLCLLSLRRYIHKEANVLDVGCGSGILAIAALKLGAAFGCGLDIDPEAVKSARENACLNGIEEKQLDILCGNILEDTNTDGIKAYGQFDIAVANILADVIIPLSSVIGSYIKPGGIFISSGILGEKSKDVEKAILANGFSVIEKNTLGEWVSFVAQKSGKD